jgi:hypothetical protein
MRTSPKGRSSFWVSPVLGEGRFAQQRGFCYGRLIHDDDDGSAGVVESDRLLEVILSCHDSVTRREFSFPEGRAALALKFSQASDTVIAPIASREC